MRRKNRPLKIESWQDYTTFVQAVLVFRSLEMITTKHFNQIEKKAYYITLSVTNEI
jgi:hypothetical protein